tara:strand:- start:272 stop:484 length:213 start_codon:yes stop_codon:yes gene_type:complete
MSIYKTLGEFAGNNITGVAGSFMLTEDKGNFRLESCHSEEDIQTLHITHTDGHHKTHWKVMYIKEKVEVL